MAFAGILVAILAASRFSVDGLRTDLLLAAGFLVGSLSTGGLRDRPGARGGSSLRTRGGLGSCARRNPGHGPHRRGAVRRRPQPLPRPRDLRTRSLAAAIGVLAASGFSCARTAASCPTLTRAAGRRRRLRALPPCSRSRLFSISWRSSGWGRRLARTGDDLAQWLALGFTLQLFAALHLVFDPPHGTTYVAEGDFLRLLAFALMLVGAWRAIRSAELGRAIAEERARVAREIHDGLGAVSVRGLDARPDARGGDAGRGGRPAAQAGGRARAAGGALRHPRAVVGERHRPVRLCVAPVRRVPDRRRRPRGRPRDRPRRSASLRTSRSRSSASSRRGSATSARHANATRAEVVIGRRPSGERFVAVEDDGAGFPAEAETIGQGLRNMRARASSIDGGFSVRSTPGLGTALEVVLRT